MQTTLSIEVVAFETDFGGVVSNTRYLEYIERGRYALLHAAGLRVGKVWREHGAQPVVRRIEIDYLGFARHEDHLQLRVRVASHGGATTTLNYELSRENDDVILMRATQTLAYLNRDWKPTRVPRIFRDALAVEIAAT
jgi:YbgC/YbaW family acyl-CoA thioester hydrolase